MLLSYDGDDNAPKVDASSTQGFEPEPTQASQPAEVLPAPNPTIINDHTRIEDTSGHNYDSDVGSGWNGNLGNEGTMIHFDDHQLEEESRPIGIKEDG